MEFHFSLKEFAQEFKANEKAIEIYFYIRIFDLFLINFF